VVPHGSHGADGDMAVRFSGSPSPREIKGAEDCRPAMFLPPCPIDWVKGSKTRAVSWCARSGAFPAEPLAKGPRDRGCGKVR
jgi:hypothetical protein